MHKVFWVSLALVVLICVVLMVKFGFKPRIVPVIKPSSFDTPQDVGRITHQLLQGYFKSKNTFVIGCPWTLSAENPCVKVGDGIVHDMERMQSHLTHVYVTDEALLNDRFKAHFPVGTVFGVLTETETNWPPDAIEALKKPESKSLIFWSTPNVFRPRRAARIHGLEIALGAGAVAITVAPLAVFKDEPLTPSIACGESETNENLEVLGCAIAYQSKQAIQARHIHREKWVAIVEQRGPLDFSLYLHAPVIPPL